jgi:hypothetical protein
MSDPIYDSGLSVQELLDRGFELPIHFAAIGANGSVVAGTYQPRDDASGLDCRITAQSSETEGLTVPVNIMFVDSRGESAVIVVRRLPGRPEENPLASWRIQ